jgi:hypothetical protein
MFSIIGLIGFIKSNKCLNFDIQHGKHKKRKGYQKNLDSILFDLRTLPSLCVMKGEGNP